MPMSYRKKNQINFLVVDKRSFLGKLKLKKLENILKTGMHHFKMSRSTAKTMILFLLCVGLSYVLPEVSQSCITADFI